MQESDKIELTIAEAKRLADLHLALAQEYRKLAGFAACAKHATLKGILSG